MHLKHRLGGSSGWSAMSSEESRGPTVKGLVDDRSEFLLYSVRLEEVGEL